MSHAAAHSLSTGPQDTPVQPTVNFPQTGGRKFSARYYGLHQWIEYSEAQDAVFCFPCRHFLSKSSVRAGETLGNRTFIEKGFKKWRDASSLFQQHENSDRHKISMKAWAELKNRSSNQKSVASLLDSERFTEIEENRKHVKILLKAVSYLGRQGLGFRGHNESEESVNKGNFLELVELVCENDSNLKERMSRRYGHYCSPEYQNDMIQVFSARIANNIVEKIKQCRFYSIMADETKDLSKSEQLAILVRYVDCDDFKIKERAIGLVHLKDCSAENITSEIFALLLEKGLEIKYCVGQCYDGANVMSGWAKGVQARVQKQASHAMYFHCHAHRLNLVLVHSLGVIEEAKDFFSTLQKIYIFISNSAPRHELFMEAQRKLNLPLLTLEKFVPTRWFYWFRSVSKILKTFPAILLVLDENKHDRAESVGIRSQMEQECFIFLLYAMELILGITFSLSEQLQADSLDLVAASHLITSTKEELLNARKNEKYEEILRKAATLAKNNGIERSENKRKKMISSRFADSVILSSVGQSDHNIKSIYFNILDTVLDEFDRRFCDNNDIIKSTHALNKTENIFLTFDALKPLIQKYENILNVDLLEKQLPLAKHFLQQNQDNANSPSEYLEKLQTLDVAFSEVISLIKIFLSLPITTASNERFFSVLKRVKNYIRTKISDDRLSALMLLAVEQEEVKKISYDDLIDDFAKMKQRRFPLLH